MSRVTSLRACSSFSLDSARKDLLTVRRAWSEEVPTTSMEPQTLSISSERCAAGMAKDFSIFSSARTLKSGSSWSISTWSKSSRSASSSCSTSSCSMTSCSISWGSISTSTGSISGGSTWTEIGGIEIAGLAKFFEMLRGLRIAPLDQLIDQRHLHERRLLLLQGVHHAAAHLRLRGVADEGVERGKAHVNAGVVAQGVLQRGENLRIETIFAAGPRDAFEALAGGLLLQHGQRDELAHAR